MRPYWSLWVLKGPDACLEILMGPYWSLSVLINPSSPCASLCLFQSPNGVLISSYLSLWIPRGFYGSLCVVMDSLMFLCVLMDSSVSLWILNRPYGFYWVFTGLYRSL